jgi:lysophospholipase L1-like esterase
MCFLCYNFCMNKKIAIIAISFVVVFAGYLFAAHYYIYWVIGRSGLAATDDRHEYVLNPMAERSEIYAALGDSLTSGVGTERYEQSYPYLLASKLSGTNRRVVNLNFSYPGARTIDLINDLLPKAIAEQPSIITVLVGVNDIHGGVAKADFVKNYRRILSDLKARTQAKVYLISIPTIGSQQLLLHPYDDFFEWQTLDFNEAIRRLAQEFDFQYIDLTTPTLKISKQDGPYYAKDKFHPSNAGYGLWADIIYDNLDK